MRRSVGILFFCWWLTCTAVAALGEAERRREYDARNYTWPLPYVVPNTEGWRKIMDRRFAQVAEISEGDGSRYEGYLQTINSAFVSPNFTETGWGLSKAPADLLAALQKGVRDGLATARSEGHVDVIEGGGDPLFIDRTDLTNRVLQELHPLEEAWSGVSLVPHQAYGFRLYRNNSRLYMHVDRSQTHVISGILHVDRSEDAEPWPIVIEDFYGNTNEVLLEPGDILFYESSKCFHGRPKAFHGSWYTSVFVHYHPLDWMQVDRKLEAHYAVPPVWGYDPVSSEQDRLVMMGTSMKEPDCPDMWCALQDSVKWQGPGEEGYFLTSNGHKAELKHFRDEL